MGAVQDIEERGMSGEAVVSPYSGPSSIMSRYIDLPNAKAALEFQKNTQGSWSPYHPLGNSCLTYCANVLRAGGADVPEGKATIPWARRDSSPAASRILADDVLTSASKRCVPIARNVDGCKKLRGARNISQGCC